MLLLLVLLSSSPSCLFPFPLVPTPLSFLLLPFLRLLVSPHSSPEVTTVKKVHYMPSYPSQTAQRYVEPLAEPIAGRWDARGPIAGRVDRQYVDLDGDWGRTYPRCPQNALKMLQYAPRSSFRCPQGVGGMYAV